VDDAPPTYELNRDNVPNHCAGIEWIAYNSSHELNHPDLNPGLTTSRPRTNPDPRM
jgi:hypothetical protein